MSGLSEVLRRLGGEKHPESNRETVTPLDTFNGRQICLAGQHNHQRLTAVAAAVAFLLLTACGDKLFPVVSGDLSCDRFRHISATDAQVDLIAANWSTWESLALQIAAHNTEYDKDCVGTASDPRGKGK